MSRTRKNASVASDDGDTTSTSSKAGQLIGDAFERAVIEMITIFLEEEFPDYGLYKPKDNKTQVRLEMSGGKQRQMDTVLALKTSDDPVALLESKWLKDGRHHNDKGAWILQLQAVKRRYPTIRGATAVVAGHWTEGVFVTLRNEGNIKMIHVATDQQVYDTLQPHLNGYLESIGAEPLILDALKVRKKFPRPKEVANFLAQLKRDHHLTEIAREWLRFDRPTPNGSSSTGAGLVEAAIRDLLSPLPESPVIKSFEITLQIESGNLISKTFSDMEEATEFLHAYYKNPEAILKEITPRPRQETEPLQSAASSDPGLVQLTIPLDDPST